MPNLPDEILDNTVGNIRYRNNVVTGEVAVDNGNYTYDCYITGSDEAYPNIPTTFKEPAFEVGDAVEILIEYGNKEMPIIIGYAKKVVQDFVEDEVNVLVTTLDAYSIEATTAYLEGRIEEIEGYENCVRRGFHYGTSTSYGDSVYTTGSFEAGSYNDQATGLTDETTYHYQAYVYDAYNDEHKGEDKTMKTGILYDIGDLATDRTGRVDAGSTRIYKNNPANFNGTITEIQIYASYLMEDMEGCRVGIFRETTANKFTTRSYAIIGDVAVGYSTHVVNLNVQIGDYIGIYYSAGKFDTDYEGAGQWRVVGNQIPCSNVLFTTFTNNIGGSIHGVGTI